MRLPPHLVRIPLPLVNPMPNTAALAVFLSYCCLCMLSGWRSRPCVSLFCETFCPVRGGTLAPICANATRTCLNRGYRLAGALVTRHEHSSKAPIIDIGSTGSRGRTWGLPVYTHHHLRLRLVSVTRRVQYPNWEYLIHSFFEKPVMDTRCRVQFETFQYNLVLL